MTLPDHPLVMPLNPVNHLTEVIPNRTHRLDTHDHNCDHESAAQQDPVSRNAAATPTWAHDAARAT